MGGSWTCFVVNRHTCCVFLWKKGEQIFRKRLDICAVNFKMEFYEEDIAFRGRGVVPADGV